MATYYAKADAAGGGAGTSGDPYTLAELNAALNAGDVGKLLDTGGDFTGQIKPANQGSAEGTSLEKANCVPSSDHVNPLGERSSCVSLAILPLFNQYI